MFFNFTIFIKIEENVRDDEKGYSILFVPYICIKFQFNTLCLENTFLVLNFFCQKVLNLLTLLVSLKYKKLFHN